MESPELLSLAYSACDIFVMPSLYEAFGQTSLEAMSCGTPVVGFDTGGIPDMVSPGKTGLLAKRGDIEDLSEKIQWMIDHPEARKSMGIAARQLVKREFTLQRQAEKYSSVYNDLMKRSIT
jgi:glycosyltransferase involved in cell wall biosynthesis